MGGFANSLLTALLSWFKNLIAGIWDWAANGNESFFTWLGEHWVMLVVILCLFGTAMDVVLKMARRRREKGNADASRVETEVPETEGQETDENPDAYDHEALEACAFRGKDEATASETAVFPTYTVCDRGAFSRTGSNSADENAEAPIREAVSHLSESEETKQIPVAGTNAFGRRKHTNASTEYSAEERSESVPSPAPEPLTVPQETLYRVSAGNGIVSGRRRRSRQYEQRPSDEHLTE